ncbi:MAG: SRPBCC domain-containing protein [Pseudomonadota bacterium]
MFEVETRIVIAAPMETVWIELIDLDRWRDWHPYMRFEGGEVKIGSTLKSVMESDTDTHRLDTTVTRVEPGRVFEWTGEIHEPAYAKGVHGFHLEEASTGTCLVQTERAEGPFVETETAPMMREHAIKSFEAANAAFKAYVERRWSSEP